MTEPFADAAKLRASYGVYEVAFGKRPVSEPALLFAPNPTPTLLLYGPEDKVVSPEFVRRAEIAFPDHVGPFVVPGAGHFLQWERADVLNGALVYLMRDKLAR
jgi:pimeloyl-ACP methyl ester carboxylesterase